MIEQLAGVSLTDVRLAGAVVGVVLLAYWTLERLRGEGDDPTLRMSSSSETGSSSALVSGTKAVGLVAGLVVALLFWSEPLVEDSRAVLLGLGILVLAHWIFEKEEVED